MIINTLSQNNILENILKNNQIYTIKKTQKDGTVYRIQ